MFEQNKKLVLDKKDKSPIGRIDERIKELLDIINKNPNYYTTSSCSGRIVLIDGEKKGESTWRFVSHENVSYDEVKSNLKGLNVWFRCEPMILHIASKDLSSAFKLVNLARNLGFRRSGIQSKNKLIIEISSSEILDTILIKNGVLLIDDNYLSVLVDEANKKLRKTWDKIEKLKNLMVDIDEI